MSTETRLKPCPFCGGAAKEFERFNANVITCRRCGVKIRQSEMGEGDAAVRWNQRATPVAAQTQQPVSGADGLPQGWRMVPEKIPMKGLDDAIAWMRPAMNQAGCDLAYCLTGAWSILLDSVTPPDHLPDATKMVEPSGNSGELPDLTIQWHDRPEEVHRIFWEKAAIENGLTYEELIEGAMVGETEGRQKVDLTYEQEIQAIRDQKCWGCADTETNQIHVWAAPDVDRTLLIHMLAHEIGHLTGVPHTDDIQEELRAETFGKVAAMAYQMLQTQQEADKVDAERMRKAIKDWFDLKEKISKSGRPPHADYWHRNIFDAENELRKSAIGAARKEQA